MCITKKGFPGGCMSQKKLTLNSNSFPIKTTASIKYLPESYGIGLKKNPLNNLLITLALDFSILFSNIVFIIRAMKMRLPTRAVIS
jgi:hypothetical protein